jgi:hypothetical protein
MQTPWGKSQQIEVIADDIKFISTASHGGFWISQERYKQMPEKYRKITPFAHKSGQAHGLKGYWYEEDCDWCLVFLSFQDIFKERDYNFDDVLYIAQKTYNNHYGENNVNS